MSLASIPTQRVIDQCQMVIQRAHNAAKWRGRRAVKLEQFRLNTSWWRRLLRRPRLSYDETIDYMRKAEQSISPMEPVGPSLRYLFTPRIDEDVWRLLALARNTDSDTMQLTADEWALIT